MSEEKLTDQKEDVVSIDSAAEPAVGPRELRGAVEEAEAVMKFPMEFPITVMGLNDPGFPKEVAAVTKAHFEDFNEAEDMRLTYSRTRKYVSVMVTVTAQSREQLDSAYLAYNALPTKKFVL